MQFITIRFIWYIAPINLVSVVQKAENAIHQINLYPLDNATGFPNTYPLNSDLSGGSAINTIYYDTIYLVHSAYQPGVGCSKGVDRYPSDKSLSTG